MDDTNLQQDKTQLLVHIKHSQPIEMNDLLKSLTAYNNLFEDYVSKNAPCKELVKAKLYVEKIQQGSIMVVLSEIIGSTLIPFLENANVIAEFLGYLKSAVSYYTEGKGDDPRLSIRDLRNLRDIFAVTATDKQGETQIGTIINGDVTNVYNTYNYNFIQSNSAQNQIMREIEARSVADINGVHFKQLMKIYQMRDDEKGNKAIIDKISKNRLAISFANEQVKSAIFGDFNAFGKLFIVDVEVQTIDDKPKLYNILHVHEVLDDTDD